MIRPLFVCDDSFAAFIVPQVAEKAKDLLATSEHAAFTSAANAAGISDRNPAYPSVFSCICKCGPCVDVK